MMAINYCLVKPSSESKAKILKFVDMLWNQVGEQVLKMKRTFWKPGLNRSSGTPWLRERRIWKTAGRPWRPGGRAGKESWLRKEPGR